MPGEGSSCEITHDIVVAGDTAFREGERVTVDQVAPHPQMPANKYVVSSTRLQQRFQLKGEDLREVGDEPPVFDQPYAPPVKEEIPMTPAVAREKEASSSDLKTTTTDHDSLSVGQIIAWIVGFGVFIAGVILGARSGGWVGAIGGGIVALLFIGAFGIGLDIGAMGDAARKRKRNDD